MKRKHAKTLAAIFSRPTPGSIPWGDIEALFKALGAEVGEREGSRIAIVLFGRIRIRALSPVFVSGWKRMERRHEQHHDH